MILPSLTDGSSESSLCEFARTVRFSDGVAALQFFIDLFFSRAAHFLIYIRLNNLYVSTVKTSKLCIPHCGKLGSNLLEWCNASNPAPSVSPVRT